MNLIKAARDLIGISQIELAEKASIPIITMRRIECRSGYEGLVAQDTVEKVMSTLEGLGVQFLENGDVAQGGGVALRKG